MEALDTKSKSLKATLAFTLPISCQICLGKVKDPVSCENSHVFCKLCIEIWCSKNSFCPTCRVSIESLSSLRHLRGGQALEPEPAIPIFSDPTVRKARIKSLFNSYEEEIKRLSNQTHDLQQENYTLHSSLKEKPRCYGSGTNASQETIRELEARLSESEGLYQQVCSELVQLKKENELLKSTNEELSKDNDFLRLRVQNSSPRKGFSSRFTVAALEKKISDQKKIIDDLERALTLSDEQIRTLSDRLQYKYSEIPPASVTNNDNATERFEKKPTLNSKLSTSIPMVNLTRLTDQSADGTHLNVSSSSITQSNSSGSFKRQLIPVSVDEKKNVNCHKHTSPVSNLLTSSAHQYSTKTSTSQSSISNMRETNLPYKRTDPVDVSLDLELPSPSSTPRAGDSLKSSDDSSSKRICIRSAECLINRRSDLASPNLHDLTLTPEFSDCLKILDEAERNVKLRSSLNAS